MAYQVEGRGFKLRIAILSFSKFTSEIIFGTYHERYGEGKHREKACTSVLSISMVCVKLAIRTEPVWELWPKPTYTERRLGRI